MKHTLVKTILNKIHKLKGFVYNSATLNEKATLLSVQIVPHKRNRPICSKCNNKGSVYDKLPERSFDFIPIWGIAVVFLYCMRRVNCKHCNCICVETVPWSIGGKSHMTKVYASYLSHWCKKLDWSYVAKTFNVSWGSIARAVEYVVDWGLDRRNLENISSIGVDEIQYKDGHRYLTMVYQLDKGCRRLLWIGKERTEKTFRGFFEMLGDARSKNIKFVCSDMWRPYINVIKEKAGTAVHILDRFHIEQKFNNAVDDVRKREVRELEEAGEEPVLKGSKWIFITKRKNLSRKKKVRTRLAELLERNMKVVKAYILKEDFSHFWTYKTSKCASAFLDKWCKKAMRYKSLPEMKKIVKMLRRHKPLILNYFEAKKMLSNSITEGLNNKVKVTIRKSYGYRTDKTREIALFHALGRLPEPTFTHKFF